MTNICSEFCGVPHDEDAIALQSPPIWRSDFRLLNTRDFTPDDFDWLTENPAVDLLMPHHGNDFSAYEESLQGLPELLSSLRISPQPPDELSECHSRFFGASPIAVDRSAGGRLDVVDGRHRLWAAFQLGIAVPVCIRWK